MRTLTTLALLAALAVCIDNVANDGRFSDRALVLLKSGIDYARTQS